MAGTQAPRWENMIDGLKPADPRGIEARGIYVNIYGSSWQRRQSNKTIARTVKRDPSVAVIRILFKRTVPKQFQHRNRCKMKCR